MDIFMIIKYGFDSSENEIDSARYKEDLGFVVDENNAISIIESLNKNLGYKYKGWDNKEYPYFECVKVKTFSESEYLEKLKREKEEFENLFKRR